MALWQGRSARKHSGGRYRPFRKKKAFEISTEFQFSTVGKLHVKKYKTRGKGSKSRVLAADTANVFNPKTGKVEKSKIVTVKSNPANPNYVQRNIITKGAIIQTELGDARITSRMGQHGIVNAVLVD